MVAAHGTMFGTVVKSEAFLFDKSLHANTKGLGSGGLRAWKETPMKRWMREVVDNAEGDSPDDEKKYRRSATNSRTHFLVIFFQY